MLASTVQPASVGVVLVGIATLGVWPAFLHRLGLRGTCERKIYTYE
jgi:hypothetical protein